MFQFTTTTILNSSVDSNPAIAKFTGAAGSLTVSRVGKFLTDKIVSIAKRPYAAGVKEIARVRIPTITSGLVARLTIDVRLSQQTNSEYANTYLYFKKPVTVEVIATGTAATDATALVAQLNGLKDRFGFAYVTAAVVNTDYVQVTATDNNQRIFSMVIEKEKASTNSLIQPEYEDVSSTTFSVTTAGKLGFGDDDWMIKSVMVPTLENTRFFGINKEERPILGGNYSEYVLRYSVAKDHEDGIVGGGTSITTHVFWVLSSLVSAWETELNKLTDKPYGAAIVAATTTTLSTAGDETVQLTFPGSNGTVTWTSDQPTRATVNSTGLVTTAGVTATGAVVITATDLVGNTDTIAITVAT